MLIKILTYVDPLTSSYIDGYSVHHNGVCSLGCGNFLGT